MIILGGGLVKHHIADACLMRNVAESAVYIITAQEFDGSDAGARPDETVSWGKIKPDANSVTVFLVVLLFYFCVKSWLAINRSLCISFPFFLVLFLADRSIFRYEQVYEEATVTFPIIVAATFTRGDKRWGN